VSEKHFYAVTVVGRDRPGIIAETTNRLAGLGLNLEDSTMTLLRGHFAMMLVCSGEAEEADIESALASLTIDRSLLVTVAEIPAEPAPPSGGTPWVLTVHGGDRTGIVSAVIAEVAAVKGNITDLTTRLAGDLYLLVAEIDLPAGVDVPALDAAVDRVAAELGVRATLRPSEIDEL
jgi:glycine cleavage system transcriptional repressor